MRRLWAAGAAMSVCLALSGGPAQAQEVSLAASPPLPSAVHVEGTMVVSDIVMGPSTTVDGIRQMRGLTATTTDTMDDPRVSGTGAIVGNLDSYGDVMTQWGTYRLENADGAWEGTWRGVLWNRGGVTEHTMWLTGSGAYEGLTYYAHVNGSGVIDIEGVIFPGEAPAP
jgi:hypothetical protein